MNKYEIFRSCYDLNNFGRLLLNIMRRLIILLVLCVSSTYANPFYSQNDIDIDLKDVKLVEFLEEIQDNTEFVFFYKDDVLKEDVRISINLEDASIDKVLQNAFLNTNLSYKISGKQVVIKKLPKELKTTSRIEKQQTITVTGTITDFDTKMTVPAANIMEKGTSNGVMSDFDGNFAIEVPEDAILVISYIGYATQEIPVNGRSQINVELKLNAAALDEVVVVGYGTQSRRDLTGSVSTMKGIEITQRKVSNTSLALQGAVPGLTVTRASSAPGAGSSVLRLRGLTTLQGDNSPLILVDDVPVGSIDDVDPNQIASISVLKDAASASIYGSRGAAGVIIITTKRAKRGEFSVSYTGETIINTPTEIPGSVGSIRHMEMMNEKRWNDSGNGEDNFPVYSEELIENYMASHAENPDQFPDTDWYDLTMKDQSLGYRHGLTLSGGGEHLKTLASFGYEKQNALYGHRKWRRYTARINNDIDFNDKFGANVDVSFRIGKQNTPTVDPTDHSVYGASIYSALYEDGRVAPGQSSNNVYAKLHYGGFGINETYEIFGKVGVFYKPVPEVKISLNLSPRYEFYKTKSFVKPIPYWEFDDPEMAGTPKYISGHNPVNSRLNESRSFNSALTTQALINYDKSFGDHTVRGVLGFEEFSQENEILKVIGKEYEVYEYPFLGEAPVDNVFDDGSGISELAYSSYFGRIQYDYKNKYLLQANVRRDGSSRFGSDYRWGTFPSISAGWVLSSENFFKNLNSPVSFLKFRGSYGKLGNDRLGNYLYLPVFQFMNTVRPNGANTELLRTAGQRYLAIEDITWETTTTLDLGFDLNLFEDKLSVTADYYKKKTEDMLLDLSIPSLSGYEDPTYNVGSMDTEGWELSLRWNDNIGDFYYSAAFNIFNSESIIGDIEGKRIIGTTTISEEGSQFRSWFGYKADGIYQTQEEVDNSATRSNNVRPGDIKYVDISGPDGAPDGLINELDRTYLGGSTSPKFEYGGNISLGYKGLDFSVTFQGVAKQRYLLSQHFAQPFRGHWLAPPTLVEGKYWSNYNSAAENAAAQYPRLSDNSESNNYTFSDFWLKNGAYMRIKNITLGYTIPSRVVEKIGLSRLRVFVAGNDLFSFDSFPVGIDPEYGGGYLITKAFILGVDVSL